MVWYDLEINGHRTKITPINIKSETFKDVDKEGNLLVKEKLQSAKFRFVRKKDNKEVDRTYKLVNGKPRQKLKKTTVVSNVVEVDRTIVYDLIIEKYYYVDCKTLLQHLQKKDKAIRFVYTNGNGYKGYIAFISVFGNDLVMFLARGRISKQIANVKTEKQAQADLETELKDDVERAEAEQLTATIEV